MEVIWSNKARKSFINVVEYILSEWTQKEVDKFVRITDSHTLLISAGILNGRPAGKRKNVFSDLLDKHNRLYYKKSSHSVFLLEFWDTRRNPSNNPLE
jgi:plasmid stabilization system protein ParE